MTILYSQVLSLKNVVPSSKRVQSGDIAFKFGTQSSGHVASGASASGVHCSIFSVLPASGGEEPSTDDAESAAVAVAASSSASSEADFVYACKKSSHQF